MYDRRPSLKPYAFILFSLFAIFILIVGLKSFEDSEESFENFTYPSDYNFHEILHSKNNSNLNRLTGFKPVLVNNVNHKNSTETHVLVVVKSSIKNLVNRDNIRKTWASKACQKSHKILIYFAIGQSKNPEKNINLENTINEESEEHQDLLRFNFVDTYKNNTYKVIAIMNHFVTFYSHVPYLLIIDDDFFMDPSMLTQTVSHRVSRFEYERFFGGYVWYHNEPQRERSSKWYVQKEQYKYKYYPPYATGGFLLISSPMVKACDKLLPYLQYSPIDDVLLGILLFKLNIYPTHLKNVITYRKNILPDDLLACHGLSKDLVEFWKENNYKEKC